MPDISSSKTDQLARAVSHADAAIWAETYLKTENGSPFCLKDHVYQLEPLQLRHHRITVRKATQGGWTLVFIIKALWSMIHRVIPTGVIDLFPTDVKVTEFSETRWTPMLQQNAYHLARYVRSTNNKHNKRVGTANLMFRGAKLSQRIGGILDESSTLRSDPADCVVADELDLMPPLALEKARQRMAHSPLKWFWALSNPTIPNYGIDVEFNNGDQRYWMCRCDSCNSWWSPDIEFPTICRRAADGSVFLACLKCGKPLNINLGQWVAKFPERSRDHISYHWSHLISVFTDLRKLLQDYESPPEGNLGDVMRYQLGQAYLDSSLGFSRNDVLLCCDPTRPMQTSSALRTAIGVDVGKQLHIVVGYRVGDDVYRIVALILAKDWSELSMAMRAFRCECASIDNEPEMHEAREFQRKSRADVWLSDYVQAVGPAAYDHQSHVVRVNRNEILDHTHYLITTHGRLVIPSQCALVEEFATQCANDVKVVEKRRGTGDAVVTYVQRGADHWRHALANFVLAAKRQVPKMDQGRGHGSGDFDLFAR